MKRNLMILTVAMLVSAAAYLNWNYSQSVANVGKILGESVLVGGSVSPASSLEGSADGTEEAGEEQEVFNADTNYFDTARLNRQEARDNSLTLLREAAADEKADLDTINSANEQLQQIAANALTESTIESLVIAKGYEDCVAFVNGESVSVVISKTEEGLQSADIAKVTDIVLEETGLTADKIKIMEAN
jgi:stage III sporulation protein AH